MKKQILIINAFRFMIILLFLFLIIVIIIGKNWYHYLLNPMSCFIGLWLLAFILFFGSDFFLHDISFESTFICILGIFAFGLGCSLSHRLWKTRYSYHLQNYEGNDENIESVINFGFYLSIICFFLNLFFVHSMVGIREYFSNMVYYKETYFSGTGLRAMIYKLFTYTKRTLMVFSSFAIYYLFVKKKSLVKCAITVALSFILSVAYSRTMVLYIFILDFITVYFCFFCKLRKKIKVRLLLVISFFILGFFVFFVNSQEKLNKTFDIEGVFLGIELPSALSTVIAYFCGTIKSSDIYLKSVNNTLPLVATFRYIYDFLGLADTTAIFAQDFVYIPFSYNTAYYQYYLFLEGGYLWVFLASLIYGYWADRAFMKMLECTNSFNIVFVSLFFLGLSMSTRSYLVMYLEFLIPLFTLLIIKFFSGKTRFVLKKK